MPAFEMWLRGEPIIARACASSQDAHRRRNPAPAAARAKGASIPRRLPAVGDDASRHVPHGSPRHCGAGGSAPARRGRERDRKSRRPAACGRQSLERARKAYFAELDLHVAGDFSGLVVDKLPLNLLGGPFIEALFPGAPIIFAQRHPCDAVLSAFMQSFVMNDAMASFLTIEDAADLYDAVFPAGCDARGFA